MFREGLLNIDPPQSAADSCLHYSSSRPSSLQGRSKNAGRVTKFQNRSERFRSPNPHVSKYRTAMFNVFHQ